MKEIILSCLDLTNDEYKRFTEVAAIRKVSKNSLLVHPGEIVNKLFFLNSGAVRAYRYVEGVDFTHFFFTGRWFVTDFKSFLTEESGDLYLETLTNAIYYEFSKSAIESLSQDYPKFEKLWKIVTERAYLFTVRRLEDMQTKNLRQRYHELIKENPELFLSFPQKHIASYLGVAQQSLSRIKKQQSIS